MVDMAGASVAWQKNKPNYALLRPRMANHRYPSAML
jgi:hypothetical protein